MEDITTMVASVLPILERWLRATVRDELEKTLESDRAKAKPDKMLTRKEVCALLHISKVTLWEKTRRGEIAATRVGRRVLYSETELKRMMEE